MKGLKQTSQADKGLTLLECLAAVAVTLLATATITPQVFLVNATRVQNQRAEQAVALAQAEMERAKVRVEQGDYTGAELPPVAFTTTTTCTGSSGTKIESAAAPNTTVASASAVTSFRQAYLVDINRDSQPDYFVQTFRDSGQVAGINSQPVTFRMGVRVYTASASSNLNSLSTEPASLKFTTGQGTQSNRPLAVGYSVLTRNDTKMSLDRYQQYITCNPVPEK
ncbi:hypothetical protein [Leptolyngbya sp. FACHB-261]|uniref:hypothetical protein n=1 Tax=Leptolyngbya sp. FACHB-261 TaxID=2692806 RepID=UPI0016832DDA|nr:hypothetical protein [Leptolyngbya sp. FACHB-261]MBD2100831.1 hypothetical protein [Leptolyngbya sp. FACHB-261]